MTKILGGANWWTTLWGTITVIAAAIWANPKSIEFLPDPWEPYVTGVAGLIFLIAGGTFAYGVKSKDVTGGTKQQTVSGAEAAPGTQSLVDATVKATIASGEPVPAEVQQKVNS